MDIDQILRKIERLEKAHKVATSAEFILFGAGQLSEAELDRRHDQRLQEIAALDVTGLEFQKALKTEERKAALLKRRLRWMKFTRGVWNTKPIDDIDWTKAQKAAFIALVMKSAGQKSFAVAHECIAKISGTSRSTVKRLIKLLEEHGLISVYRSHISRECSEWNRYTFQSPKLLAWVARKFKKNNVIEGGVKTEPHLRTINGSVSTQDEIEEQNPDIAPTEREVQSCRQKAGRYVEFGADEGISSEDFVLLAAGALRELGETPADNPTEAELIRQVEAFRAKKHPEFIPYIWEKGVRTHGLRRALLAVLCTQMTKEMRLAPIPDKRPFNERETVKCANRFLFGILKRERSGDRPCRPEITIGSALLHKQVYELPSAIVRAVRGHNQQRAKIKRYQSSAA